MGTRLLLCVLAFQFLTPVGSFGQTDEVLKPNPSSNEQEAMVEPNRQLEPEPESGNSIWTNAKKEIQSKLRDVAWPPKQQVEYDLKQLRAALRQFEEHLAIAKVYDQSPIDQFLGGGRRRMTDRARDFGTHNAMKEQIAALEKIEGQLDDFRVVDYANAAWERLSGEARERVIADRALSAKERVALKIVEYIPPSKHASFTNSADLRLVSMPPGTFSTVINSDGDKREFEISKPTWIGETEITRSQFEQVLGTTEYDSAPTNQKTLVDPSLHQEVPATVTWFEGVEFCQKLSMLSEEKAQKRYYRLPTEAEWEHACRAGSKTEFSFGKLQDLNGQEANMLYEDTPLSKQLKISLNFKGLIPVGSFSPNAFGLYDMHGNAGEWCGDWFDNDYFGKCPMTDPPGPKDCTVKAAHFVEGQFQPPTMLRKVIRGGSYNKPPVSCNSQAVHSHYFENDKYGFRIVCEIGSPSAITLQQYGDLKNFKNGKPQPSMLVAYRESLALFRKNWELLNAKELPEGENWLRFSQREPDLRVKYAYRIMRDLQNVYKILDAEEHVARTTAEKVKHLEKYLSLVVPATGKDGDERLELKKELALDYVILKQYDKAKKIAGELRAQLHEDPEIAALWKEAVEADTK